MCENFYQAKELDANTEYYIELLAKGTGKSKEEIAKDIRRPKYFQGQEAIEYGIVDKIIDSRDSAFEKRVTFFLYHNFITLIVAKRLHVLKSFLFIIFINQNYDEMLTQSRAMRRTPGGPQAAPSGFR